MAKRIVLEKFEKIGKHIFIDLFLKLRQLRPSRLPIKRNFSCNKRKNHNVWNKFCLEQVSFDTKKKKI